jgi:hypothetical protein
MDGRRRKSHNLGSANQHETRSFTRKLRISASQIITAPQSRWTEGGGRTLSKGTASIESERE